MQEKGIRKFHTTAFKAGRDKTKDELIEELYKTVGKLQLELEWLKKKLEIVSY